jgi:hypothetical protein
LNLTKSSGGHDMISSTFDRRRAPRHPVQQIGMISARSDGEPRYCLIVDRSDGGVRLRTTSNFEAPDQSIRLVRFCRCFRYASNSRGRRENCGAVDRHHEPAAGFIREIEVCAASAS